MAYTIFSTHLPYGDLCFGPHVKVPDANDSNAEAVTTACLRPKKQCVPDGGLDGSKFGGEKTLD